MFSPIQAITAGTLAIALAGVLLIAQPFDDGNTPAPAATSDGVPAAPVEFTGLFKPSDSIREPIMDTADGRVETRGATWTPEIVRISDPRLDGQLIYMEDVDGYAASGTRLSTITYRIENDDGAWQGSQVQFTAGRESPAGVVILTGEGAYEGLYAVMTQTTGVVSGVIFPAPPPTVSTLP